MSLADCLDATGMRLNVDHVGGQRGREPSSGILTERTAPGDQAHPAALTRGRSRNDSVTRVLDSHRVAKLREELVAIIAADEKVRYRDPDRGGCGDFTIGPGKRPGGAL